MKHAGLKRDEGDVAAKTKPARSPAHGDLRVGNANDAYEQEACEAHVKKFVKAESDWRDMVTYWLLYYKMNGPDYGRSKCDELLNSDQYGGKLKQTRQTFGG